MVPADLGDLCSKEVVWVGEHWATATAMAMVRAMVRATVTVCGAAKRMENAMETSRPSFCYYMANLSNCKLPTNSSCNTRSQRFGYCLAVARISSYLGGNYF